MIRSSQRPVRYFVGALVILIAWILLSNRVQAALFAYQHGLVDDPA